MPELHGFSAGHGPEDPGLMAAFADALAELPARQRLVVGVSGGLDSMLLLAVAQQYVGRQRALQLPVPALLVVHVHHGLSAQADAWAGHVQRYCAQAGIACEVRRVVVDRQQASREAAARDARHAALESLLQPGDALLLAHHADDQAETFLLRLLRGSGVTGLAAMRVARRIERIADTWLLRPFLAMPRARLLAAVRQCGLAWVEDESNADHQFDRNHLRHEVLPVLQARWPALAATLGSTARRLADADDLLSAYLDADLAPLLVPVPVSAVTPASAALQVAGLLVHAPARQRALLRRWLHAIGAPLFHEAWIDELRALAAAKADSEGALRVAGWEVHRFRGQLHAFPALPEPTPDRVLDWDLRGMLDLGAGCGCLQALPACEGGEGLWLAGLLPGTPATVHFRRGGERIRLHAGSGRRALKKVLQEQEVPPWLRSRLPLLSVDGQLLAVGDLFADVSTVASDPVNQSGLLLRWR